jgi:hypothetical protein
VKIDHPRPRTLESHQAGAARGDHPPTRDREVAVDPETRKSERADATAREDQVGFHARLD